MKGDVPVSMRKPHDLRGNGKPAWYYIEPVGLRIYQEGGDGKHLIITRKQLERAVEIIKQEDSQ